METSFIKMETLGIAPKSRLFSNQTSTCVVSYLSFANLTQTNMVYYYYLKLVSHYILLRKRIINYPVIVLTSLTGVRSKQPNLA